MIVLSSIVIAKILILLSSPFVSFMLYDWMQKGMIFEFYGDWVNKESDYNKSLEKAKQEHNLSKENIELLENAKIQIPFIKHPLGYCLKCFHVWVFFGFFGLTFFSLFISGLLGLLGLSYGILFKLFYK